MKDEKEAQGKSELLGSLGPQMRSEQEIFDELAKVCASPGYVHAIALFCEGVTGVQLVAFFGAKKEIWITHNCAWDECGNR